MEPTPGEDIARLQMMEAEIIELIGDPRCSEVSECAAVAFGSKPCGGLWKYLVYSTATVDEGELREKVDEYNAFNAVVNQRHRIWSDCEFVSAPELGCIDAKCVALDDPL